MLIPFKLGRPSSFNKLRHLLDSPTFLPVQKARKRGADQGRCDQPATEFLAVAEWWRATTFQLDWVQKAEPLR